MTGLCLSGNDWRTDEVSWVRATSAGKMSYRNWKRNSGWIAIFSHLLLILLFYYFIICFCFSNPSGTNLTSDVQDWFFFLLLLLLWWWWCWQWCWCSVSVVQYEESITWRWRKRHVSQVTKWTVVEVKTRCNDASVTDVIAFCQCSGQEIQ